MLVLSRMKDESIIIDGRITVMVVDVRGDTVRLGITADKAIRVDRAEIHELREKAKAEREASGEGTETEAPTSHTRP